MYLFIEANNQQQAHLYLYDQTDFKVLTHKSWPCQRQLAATLLKAIVDFLDQNKLEFKDLQGLGVFAGPAGFTDLRVTHTIANTLAYSFQIPIVNFSQPNWQKSCWQKLKDNVDLKIVKPNYGRPPTITRQVK